MNSESIERLIPQRAPVMMVDELLTAEEDTALTTLAVRPDNYFLADGGYLVEAGLIEHIAQSALALAGYRAVAAGAATPPMGLIGEVKNFHCYCHPRVGDELRTTVTMGTEVAGLTLVTGKTCVCGKPVAETSLKIFVTEDK